jgi:hypothetical protein
MAKPIEPLRAAGVAGIDGGVRLDEVEARSGHGEG